MYSHKNTDMAHVPKIGWMNTTQKHVSLQAFLSFINRFPQITKIQANDPLWAELLKHL